MKKTIGIFAKHIRIASRFLDEIIGEMLYKNVSKVIKTNHRHEVELSDGTIYKAILTNESSRGIRLTDACVHKDVEAIYVTNVIMPFILADDESESRITFFE